MQLCTGVRVVQWLAQFRTRFSTRLLISLHHLHVLEEKLKVVTSASVHFGLKGKLELLQLEEKEKLFQDSRLDWQRHLLLHLLAVPCEYLDEDQQDVDVVWDVQQGEAASGRLVCCPARFSLY